MTARLSFRTTLALAMAFVACGCNTSSSGGNAATAETFTIKAPATTTSLKQGERQIVTVTINRSGNFKQALAFDATEMKGLKISIDKKRVAASDPAEIAVTVEADKTAPLGEQTVKITATPETGTATSVDMKIKIEEGPK